MPKTKLPETVRQAWGAEAAADFTKWLEEWLGSAGLALEVQVSAFVARQKVNVLMLERVSNLLLADEPELIQMAGQEWVWRVPVDLTFPSRGRVGRVGEVDVDARYGEVRYTEAGLQEIADRTRQLVQQIRSPGVSFPPDFNYNIHTHLQGLKQEPGQ